jgi:hypothetical protein
VSVLRLDADHELLALDTVDVTAVAERCSRRAS